MSDGEPVVVNITLRQRDGYVMASSPDVPGLHVCGTTVASAMASAERAAKWLLKNNSGLDVSVRVVGDRPT